jgi:S1-C subfamily serine protease
VGVLGGWLLGRNTSAASVASPTPTPTIPAGADQDALRVSVIERFRPAVVQINVTTQAGKGSLGSGTIIDSRGYIVTNDHVVTGAKSLQVELFDGTKLPAQLVGLDPLDDLAVVKITSPPHMAVAKLGDSSRLRVGQTVLAIGSPLGVTQTVTSGIVSALGRNVPGGEEGGVIFNAIQMDAAINPGNSGGALVDLQGDLVGIPTLAIVNPSFNTPASGLGFSIPANRAAFIVPQLIQSGKVTDFGLADLGLEGTTVDATAASQLQLPVTQGVLVASVAANGPAAQAGVKAGDVIVRINSTAVTDEAGLLDNVLNKSPGDKVTLQVYRGSQLSTVNVTLGKLSMP